MSDKKLSDSLVVLKVPESILDSLYLQAIKQVIGGEYKIIAFSHEIELRIGQMAVEELIHIKNQIEEVLAGLEQ